MFSKIYLFILGLSCLVFSCDQDSPMATTQSDYNYFPLKPGSFAEYDVERTSYSFSSLPEIIHLRARHVVTDTFRNINNQLVYKIEHDALDARQIWKLDSVSTAWQTTDKIFVQENGQVVVKFTFPLSEGLMWNGNAYNTLMKESFNVLNLNKKILTDSYNFPETVTIIRRNDSTLLSKNKYIEVYAKNVGLIRKEKISLQYCYQPDCRGKGIIESGWKEISVIKNYGK